MATRKLEVILTGDASGAKKAFDQVERDADAAGSGIVAKLKGRLGGLSGIGTALAGGLLGGGVVAGFTGLSSAVSGVVGEYQDSVKVGRETERVIKTTGGAAHVTAGQVGDLAARLSEKAGIDDELIQNGANLLLTFTNVRNEAGKGNDIFNQGVRIAADMSTALGTDLKGASIQVGKALNDPVKGITVLSRAGVSFTDDQKNLIKYLVATGNTLGAQKIILAELQKEFGGAAEAAATPLDKLKTKIGNFQEAVGTWAVEKALPWLQDVAPKIGRAFSNGWNKIEETFRPVVRIVEQLWNRFGDNIINTAKGFVRGIGTAISGIANIFRGIFSAISSLLSGDFSGVWEGLKTAFGGVIEFLKGLGGQILSVFLGFGSILLEGGLALIQAIWDGLEQGVPKIITWFSELPGKVIGWIGDFVTVLVPKGIELLAGLLTGLVQKLPEIASFLAGIAGQTLSWIGDTTLTLIEKGVGFIAGLLQGLINKIPEVASFLAGIPGSAISWIGDTLSTLFNKGLELIAGFIGGIAVKAFDLAGRIAGLPGQVVEWLGDLGRTLFNKGVQLIQGFIDGIKSKARDIPGAIADAIPGGGIVKKGAGLIGDIWGGVGDIIGLAAGGFVTKPTLAMIGEGTGPELVLPLNDPRRMSELLGQAQRRGFLRGATGRGAGRGSAVTPIVVQLMLDGRVIAEEIVDPRIAQANANTRRYVAARGA